MKKQIIALGGGGFSMEPDNPLLDMYILRQAGKEIPRVCFVGTASADSETYLLRFYTAFARHSCKPSHLSLFKLPTADLESYILEQDILYVGGGNTRSMLALWREWGVDRYMRMAWEQGVVLTGISAGSICWFEEGLTDSVPGKLYPLPCLGLLKGSNCPHYDGEPERRPTFTRLIAQGNMQEGMAAEDGVALHYIDRDLHRVVSSRPGGKAYRVKVVDGTAVEEAVESIYLGETEL